MPSASLSAAPGPGAARLLLLRRLALRHLSSLMAAGLLLGLAPLAASAHPDHQQPSQQHQKAGESSQHHHH